MDVSTVAVFSDGRVVRVYETSEGLDGALLAMQNEGILGEPVIMPDDSVLEGDLCWDISAEVPRKMTGSEMVAAGRIKVEPDEVLDGETIRKMTLVERIEAGIENAPDGKKVSGGELVDKTDEDFFDDDPEQWKRAACASVEDALSISLSSGFAYGGATIQADAVAQQNANGYLTMMTNGVSVLPIVWRTKDNAYHHFTSEANFKAFCGAMLEFVQGRYRATWEAKDSIRAAKTYAEALSARNSV